MKKYKVEYMCWSKLTGNEMESTGFKTWEHTIPTIKEAQEVANELVEWYRMADPQINYNVRSSGNRTYIYHKDQYVADGLIVAVVEH